jgi:hypothetical protein
MRIFATLVFAYQEFSQMIANFIDVDYILITIDLEIRVEYI